MRMPHIVSVSSLVYDGRMSTPPSNSQQCQATRRDGQPCTAGAGAAGRCIGHRPEAAAARSNGGKGRATAARAAKHGPPALAGIGVDLADARAAVRKGDLAPSQGQAIASLARAEIAIWEAGEAAARLAVLERLLAPGDSE